MNSNPKNYVTEVFISSNLAVNDLSRVSDQIKANIAVTLLKHKLKNYLSDVN